MGRKKYNGIKIGDLVENQITGFKGIAVARSKQLSGNVTFNIEAPKIQGEKVDVQMTDYQYLRVLEENKAKAIKPPKRSEIGIELGDLARDQINGFEGIVTMETVHLNGCFRLYLEDRQKGSKQESQSADWHHTEVVTAGAFTLDQVAAKEALKERGGPTRSLASRF